MSDEQIQHLQTWALWYTVKKKWAVVPVHRLVRTVRPTGVVLACSCGVEDCAAPGKHAAIPIEDAYRSDDFASGGRLEMAGGWGERNIGVVCGSHSGIVGINVQPGAGEDSWKRLVEREVGGDAGLVGTLTVSTGSGGRILIYASPPGLVIDANRFELESYPGVSILGDGAYVILPPSTHHTTAQYTWDYGMSATEPIERLPSGMLVKLMEEGTIPALMGDRLSTFVDPDDPWYRVEGARTLSDLGNARRLIDRNGDTITFTEGFGWRAWLGNRWTDRLVESVWIRNRAEAIPKIIADERRDLEACRIPKKPEDMTAAETAAMERIEKRIKALRAHELASRSDGKISATIRRAASDPRIARAAETWDRDETFFGVPNGYIDLETGALRPMERNLYISKYGPIPYVPGASKRTECPEFWSFLEFITNGDEEYIEYLQHWAGFSMTGLMTEKALIFCQGPGNTGKTTFADAMLGICGDYGITVDERLVSRAEHTSGNTETSAPRLIGKRFAVAADIPTHDFNADFLKKVSGGDQLTGRLMQQNAITFDVKAKLWIFSNHFPNIRDKQLMERMRVLPFTNQSRDANRGRSVWTRQEAWGDGGNAMMRAMMDWAVEGARRYIALGHMPACSVAEKAKAEYETTGDIFMPFVRERCREDADATIDLLSLYAAYESWNSETRFIARTPSRSVFKNIVTERNFTVETVDGIDTVKGLTIRPVALPAYLRRDGAI